METDLAVASPFSHTLHFGEIEGLARFAADGSFDLQGADRHGDAPGCPAAGFAFQVVDCESRFAGGKRDEMEAAEGLATIATVVEEVALLLHQHAALVTRQKADGEVIGEGAGREPTAVSLPRAAATDCSSLATTPPME